MHVIKTVIYIYIYCDSVELSVYLLIQSIIYIIMIKLTTLTLAGFRNLIIFVKELIKIIKQKTSIHVIKTVKKYHSSVILINFFF